MEKFKYLGVAFTSDGRQDEELVVGSHKASAVMQSLYHSVVLKRELSKRATLLIFQSIFVSILIYDHESCGMTKKAQSQMQASQMKLLRKSKGTVFDKCRNTAIPESLDIESLLLRIKRSPLRWYDHASRILHKRFTKQT